MFKLKEFRKSLGMTQREFAEILDIKRKTLSCYEIRKRFPRERNLQKILNYAKENNFLLTHLDLMKLKE